MSVHAELAVKALHKNECSVGPDHFALVNFTLVVQITSVILDQTEIGVVWNSIPAILYVDRRPSKRRPSPFKISPFKTSTVALQNVTFNVIEL